MPGEEILLTFDYELFLGRSSGSVEKCLIAPTREILKLIRQYRGTAIFFVDATYLLKIEESDKQTYALITSQIEEMVNSGCEVGLHLHPHWLDAVKLGADSWSLENMSRYRLHALDEGQLRWVFGASLDSLTRAAQRADNSYRVNTFRAGGWCLQPFSMLRSLFEECRIEYDFSVTAGMYKNGLPGHFYDYRGAPKDKVVWRFTNDPCVPEQNGKFIEVPVTAFKPTLLNLILNKYNIRKESVFGDGLGASGGKGRARELIAKALASEKNRQLTLDMSSVAMLKTSLCRTQGTSLRVFASHPKIFSHSSLLNLEYLLARYQPLQAKGVLKYVD